VTCPLVVLVGAPGAGKTTIGALAAEALGVGFLDTDRVVEAEQQRTVAEIFIDSGEARFRALEAVAVLAALAAHDGVLALGGGAVLDISTRDALRRSGAPVVWLRVDLADAVERVGLARARPVLALNPRATLAQLLAARAPLYAEVATHTVETDARSPADIAAAVLDLIGEP